VGIHFTRSEVTFAVTNLEAEVLAQDRAGIPSAGDSEATLALVQRKVYGLVEEAGLPWERVLGVGVGAVGPLGFGSGSPLLAPPDFAGWHDFPLKEELERLLGMPVIVENNVTAATLGEKWAGSGKGVSNFAYLYLGRGVGLGTVVGDQIYRGTYGNGGEVAHIQVEPDGPPCYCGNRGCLEVYATPQGILREARQAVLESSHLRNDQDVVLPRTAEEVVRSENSAFAAVVRKAGEHVGRVVWSIVSILDPQIVVLGGPTSELLGPPLKEAISEVLWASSPPNKPLPRVGLSSLGANAGPVGAASLVYQGFYAPSTGRLSLT